MQFTQLWQITVVATQTLGKQTEARVENKEGAQSNSKKF
jgi:hypothetical protein